ncbi:hypothetical protein AAFF_G00203870 [Aldrovandia affinis]|uniref:Uncharacterized protein n=1 Tax=Aldrovandia affinis TaxID=143900 RepID=A0AAD7SZ89_9TELE|nr:hypothetical protein AAFF_G00203870 [Aldrovandia affinis]
MTQQQVLEGRRTLGKEKGGRERKDSGSRDRRGPGGSSRRGPGARRDGTSHPEHMVFPVGSDWGSGQANPPPTACQRTTGGVGGSLTDSKPSAFPQSRKAP